MSMKERLAAISDELKEMGWDTGLGLDTVKRDVGGKVVAVRDSNQFVHDVEDATSVIDARGALAELVGRSAE